jgi:hypothetical protein
LRTLTRALCATLWLISLRATAEEPLFGFVSTTDLLPHDKYEAAQWLSWMDGDPVGQFDVVEGRTEFEFGLSDRLQVAAYLNYEWADTYHNNVISGATMPPASLANLSVGPYDRLDTTRLTAGSLEGIYRVLSPYIDPLGLALYVRPSMGPQFREVEARLIVQENFVDDRLVVAFNIDDTVDRQYIPVVLGSDDIDSYRTWENSSTLAFGLASSYRFATGWSAGVELLNDRGHSGLDTFNAATRTDVAYYLGPTLHYANQHMFATLTYLTQLPLASDYANSHPDFIVGGRDFAPDNERLQLRFKIGYFF